MSSIGLSTNFSRAKDLPIDEEEVLRLAEKIQELDRLYGSRKKLAFRIDASEEIISKAYASESGSRRLARFLLEVGFYREIEKEIQKKDALIMSLEHILAEKLKR